MSKVSKKDFAELAGIELKHVMTYAKRGKIVIDSNGFIDTKNEANKLFMAKKSVRNEEKLAGIETKSSKKEENSQEKINARMDLIELERARKEADLENKKIEIRLNLLKEEKLMGSTMPIDLVKNIVANLGKSYMTEFKNGVDNIIRVLMKSKDYSRDEVADIRGSLMNVINESMKKSVNSAKKDIKVIAENYSITRSVGEHD
jgi:phage terminase Nu1 subunit (DNA packaging protein)